MSNARIAEQDMTKDFAEIAHEVVTGVGLLQRGAPDTMKAFGALSAAATAPKAIDTKTKELMALAIGIAVHCDGCIAYHTKMAHQHGATREEVAETVEYLSREERNEYGLANRQRRHDRVGCCNERA